MKLFISQPMKGIPDEEIKRVKKEAIEEVQTMFGEEVHVIDSFVKKDPPKGINPGVWYLGQSLVCMSKADVIYFAKGWREARGCVLENSIALQYDMCCIQTS